MAEFYIVIHGYDEDLSEYKYDENGKCVVILQIFGYHADVIITVIYEKLNKG